ncbi:MAG: ArnT family glycosyltransferase, partial [Chitinophagaceae bacterium]
QAFGTELLDDEAYYWVYSRFIDWGYYDHPPVVALLIKWGYALQQGELGVRLFMVLMSTATIIMMEKLMEKKDDTLFYALSLSVLFLQFGGLIAVPDVPLMFFVALYFLVLKAFLNKPNTAKSIVLGVVIALMLYSKYHGTLIVLFTLMARPHLLKDFNTWTAAGVAGILFFPHMMWQYLHGFPSVNYHLFERNALEYSPVFTLEFIVGQLLLAGPFIGWLIIYAACRKKALDPFTKILSWTTIGIFSLFLLATLKGRAEGNWTIPAYVGLIVLAHQWLTEHNGARKWVFKFFLPTLSIAVILRIYMFINIEPLPFFKKDEFHKNQEWANTIKAKANGAEVIFLDSYQRASKYWFYSGDTTFSINTVHYRRSNYNFWPLEERLQGKSVLIVHDKNVGIFNDSLYTEKKPMFVHKIDSFYSYAQVEIEEVSKPKWEKKNFSVNISAHLQQNRLVRPNTKVYLAIYSGTNDVEYLFPTDINVGTIVDVSTAAKASIDLGIVKPGVYRYKWAVESCIAGWPTLNSTSKTIVVE